MKNPPLSSAITRKMVLKIRITALHQNQHPGSVVQAVLGQCSGQVRAAQEPTGHLGLGVMSPNAPPVLAASRCCCSPDWTSRAARIKRSLVLRDVKISRRMARNEFHFVAANSILYLGSTEATEKNELCRVVLKQKNVGEDTVRRIKFLRKLLH